MSTITHIFNSHKRIMNGLVVSHDYVPRQANIEFDSTGRRMIISIIPTLSPKGATFYKDEKNVLYYRGDDPDFQFEIETWPDNNTIKRLSVIRLDRDLEIQYLSEHQDSLY